MTEPGDLVHVVTLDHVLHDPSVSLFASSAGAKTFINKCIDELLSRYQYKGDPGPNDAEERLFWWNLETATHRREDQTFITYTESVVED